MTGCCCAGSLLELPLAADRSYMLAGLFTDAGPDAEPAVIAVGEMNLGPLPMGNGLTRMATRFLGDPDGLAAAEKQAGEERASFSPDALTGMEANYRFAGPETMETKIFGRLSAWQNWIFTRPNA